MTEKRLSENSNIQPSNQPSSFFNSDMDEYSLPKATLTQMIKELLPQEVKMSCQSSDLIIQLTMIFLNHLSDSSNNVCSDEGKKTITPSHVAKALKELKMNGYLSQILELGLDEAGDINLSEKQTKEIISQKLDSQGGRKKKKRGKKDNENGATQEELLAEQQRLFENAKNFNYENEVQSDNNDYQQLNNNEVNIPQLSFFHTQSTPLPKLNNEMNKQNSSSQVIDNIVYKEYNLQMQQLKQNNDVDEINFDEDEDESQQQQNETK